MFSSPALPPGREYRTAEGGGSTMDVRVATSPRSRIDTGLPTLLAHVPDYESDIEQVLITREQIEGKLRELGEQITGDYRGENLLLVGVLKGAFVLMADLSRH